MASQGYITPAQERRALKSELHVLSHDTSRRAARGRLLRRLRRAGARRPLRRPRGLRRRPARLHEPRLGLAERRARVVKNTVTPLNFGFKPSAAMVAIDPANGYIRAMVGGLDFAKQQFNLASQARRQPGSAMKPFVLAAAVEQGMDPFTTYYSSQSPVTIPMGPYAAPWVVHGDGPGGPETVAQAMTISDNAVFARLSVDVGPENTVRVAHAMGITSPLAAVPSITLGTSSVTPLEMADAYATLADGGIHHAPQAVVKVVAANGKLLWRPSTKGNRAIPAGVASTVTQVLEQVGQPRYRRHHRGGLSLPACRQDRHHREQLGRLVCRLHAAARDQRLDGRHGRQPADERRLRRVLLRADVGAVHGGGAGRRRASRLSRRQLGLHALARSSRHRIAAAEPFELSERFDEAVAHTDRHDNGRCRRRRL